MRYLSIILCAFVASATVGCAQQVDIFPEQEHNQPVTVYAMGDWPEVDLTLIKAAFNDWNNGIQIRCQETGDEKKERFIFGGKKPNASLYDENSASDGIHGIYRLEPDELTEFGQQVWDEHREEESEAGTFKDNDDILLYWTLGDAWLPAWFDLQPIIAHELGHGGGLEHTAEDTPYKSIMKEQKDSFLVQSVDIDEYVRIHGCRVAS